MLRKIISGGQQGAEQAALDAALKNSLKTGGWCNKGKLSGDGAIPMKYELREMPFDDPSKKYELNLREATGTIVIFERTENAFTHQLVELGKKYNKPCLLVDLHNDFSTEKDVILLWLDANKIVTLFITGPEENVNGDFYKKSLKLMNSAFIEKRIEEEDEYND